MDKVTYKCDICGAKREVDVPSWMLRQKQWCNHNRVPMTMATQMLYVPSYTPEFEKVMAEFITEGIA